MVGVGVYPLRYFELDPIISSNDRKFRCAGALVVYFGMFPRLVNVDNLDLYLEAVTRDFQQLVLEPATVVF